jgi:thiol-disulfide isomerase/thioredoxin
MRKSTIAVILLCLAWAATAQDVRLIKFDRLQTELERESDKLRVYNFWATWCGPCIKEMPYFEAASARGDVEVIFISVDFPNQHEKVKKLIAKKEIKSPVFHLDEKNAGEFIEKISENWSGAIPATLFVDTYGDQYFYEKEFSSELLNETIKKHLN